MMKLLAVLEVTVVKTMINDSRKRELSQTD